MADELVRQIWPPLPVSNATVTATWVMFGLAGAAAIAAGVAGGLTTTAGCPAKGVSAQAVAECQVRNATVTDVAWGIAGASAVTGGVLLLTWLPKSATPEGGAHVAFGIAPPSLFVRPVSEDRGGEDMSRRRVIAL